VSITGHKKTKETSKLKKIVVFKKENRDHKKLLKQDENTGNVFYYILDPYTTRLRYW